MKNLTISLGIIPSSLMKPNNLNCQISSIRHSLDGIVKIVLQCGMYSQTLEITEQEAVRIGFINPEGLRKYCEKFISRIG